MLFLISFPSGVNRARVYWIGLITVLRAVCKYYDKWKDYLPDDLPPAATAAVIACDTACAALRAYDLAKKRGVYQEPGDNN